MSRTFTSATRVLRALKALKGNALHGLSNTELAQLTGDSPSNITRASNPEEMRAALMQETGNPVYHPDVDQFIENLITELSVADQMNEELQLGEQP